MRKNEVEFWLAATLGHFQSFLFWLSFPYERSEGIYHLDYARQQHDEAIKETQ
jgi:hypothetical protein